MRPRPPHPHQRQAAAAQSPPPDQCTPADRYQDLFVAVQSQRVFDDSKSFVDCVPLQPPEEIMRAWQSQRHRPGFDLRRFVGEHFGSPAPAHRGFHPHPGWTMEQHIDALWHYLRRDPSRHPYCSSLLQLPHPYVVPGGRFGELYYWDSYFTMLGLAESGLAKLLHAMTDNFAYLIDTYGHVPNGTRSYYLSRSQPPVFALMTRLCEARGGPQAANYLPQLRREHAFWMDGEQHVRPGQAHRRVVMLRDGGLLNRYWDDRCTPREESWREDVATAGRSGRDVHEVYRHLRAAAESGWDFSTRWLAEDAQGRAGTDLATILTTDIVPVDLNAFLHFLEGSIAHLAQATGEHAVAAEFEQRVAHRGEALQRHCWNEAGGFFADFDWRQHRQRRGLTAATVAPLYCGCAEAAQAERLAGVLRARLLAPGGLATTECASPEQWDRPNGFAPLQWMAVEGLRGYGQHALAEEIRARWMRTVQAVYDREHKLLEKYELREAQAATGGSGGEYPLQDGFGWTNGVARRWLAQA